MRCSIRGSPFLSRMRQHSRRGLLLLDAVLSATVIAVGLVFITRGLAGQLRTLRTLEETEMIAALGQSKLVELEAGVRLDPQRVPQQITDASFEALYGEGTAAYRWSVHAVPVETSESPSLETVAVSQITLTIQRPTKGPIVFTLHALWPKDWVPPSWF